jgi:hypothetical protein
MADLSDVHRMACLLIVDPAALTEDPVNTGCP